MRRDTPGVLLCALLLLPGLAFAQTSGRLVGTILDAKGAGLSGVTVHVTGPNLQGVNTAVTDHAGRYRFPTLPPGVYSVKSEFPGFLALDETVRLGIDQTITLNLTMPIAGASETINVTGEAPAIDTTSAEGGIGAGQELFSQLPVRRDFYAIARIAPGVTQDYYGQSIGGSTSTENQYIVDGLNITGVERGREGKTLNFDFIQEVEVKTGGLNAEYGRTTGGAVSVVTRSGGNGYHGDAFGFFEHAQASAVERKLPQTATTVQTSPRTVDYGVDLGGRIIRDQLWFFGGFDRVQRREERTIIRKLTAPGSPAVGDVVPQDRASNLFAGKLTYKVAQGQTLVGSVFGDPNTSKGYVFTISGSPSTWQGTLEQGGIDAAGRYEGVFGSRSMLQVQYAEHHEKNQYTGTGASTPQLIDQTVSPSQASGGFADFDNNTFTRGVLKGDVTHDVASHTIRAGADWERVDANVDRYQGGGGQRIYKLRSLAGNVYYRHRYYVNDQAPGYNRSDPMTWQIALPLNAKPRTVNRSFYAQDSYRVTSGLSLNYGVRWEGIDVQGRAHTSAFQLNENWAPRIGVVWDPTNAGKSKVYGNWGRFYEAIPMDINIRAFGGEATAFSYNYSPNGADTLPVAGTPLRSTLLGGSAEPVDPDLKGQYIDEILGGFEYEVMAETTVGVRVTHRELGRVIEDFLVPSEGQSFVANPGEGAMGQRLSLDGVSSAPAPRATRNYTATELTLKKRYRNNWQAMGSYVWSRLEGNYDGTFQASTGQLDPNNSSAFDYADFTVNAEGPLTGQRKHQIKLDGSYTVAGGAADGLSLGGSFHWYSGTPLTAYGYSFGYANWEYYLTPRGSLGYNPADWEGDIHVGYPLKIGATAKANLLLDIFNVFNRQGITNYDQRYNLAKDGACGGVPERICNGDGGLRAQPNTTTPVGQLSNPRTSATNPDFLKAGWDSDFPISFTPPRAIRVGVRVTW